MDFQQPLTEAIEKLAEYHDRTEDSMVILWQWVGQIASCVIHYHLHFFSSSSSQKAHTYQEVLEQEASP